MVINYYSSFWYYSTACLAVWNKSTAWWTWLFCVVRHGETVSAFLPSLAEARLVKMTSIRQGRCTDIERYWHTWGSLHKRAIGALLCSDPLPFWVRSYSCTALFQDPWLCLLRYRMISQAVFVSISNDFLYIRCASTLGRLFNLFSNNIYSKRLTTDPGPLYQGMQ